MAASWQTIAAQKRERDMAKIPAEWRLPQEVLDRARQQRSIADDFIDGLLDAESRSPTNPDTPALMAMTANGSLSAVRLTTAFCKRAAYAHQLNKNLLQIGFGNAIERAKELDAFWETHQRPVGPPRPSHHHEGPVSRQGHGHHDGIRRLDCQF
jgi:amidase